MALLQTLTLTVDNNPVCEGNTVIFSLHVSGIFLGQIEAYELYKNNIPVEKHSTSLSDDEFTVIADETAEFYAKVYIGDIMKTEVPSEPILLTVNHPTTATFVESSCNLYEWHDVLYYESGTYHFDTINAITAGCTFLGIA